MAARKSTRGARSHARSANRPRTHPFAPTSISPGRELKGDVTRLKGLFATPNSIDPLVQVADDLENVASVIEVCICAIDSLMCESEAPIAISFVLEDLGLDPLRERIRQIENLARKRP